ncbi:MAG TPA: hypothetical protein VGS41_12535, partial [Chthonomonadales bacterium]|nr:hypothetical protein [Chthonomonadales bacterium]
MQLPVYRALQGLCCLRAVPNWLHPGISAVQNFVRFLKEIRAYWRVMALIGVLTLITSALSLPMPLVIQYLTDHLSTQAFQ